MPDVLPGPVPPRPVLPGAVPPTPVPPGAVAPTAVQPSADQADVVVAVTQRLAALRERPVHEHVVAYDEVHRLLHDALTRLDEG